MSGVVTFLIYLWNGGLDPKTADPGVLRERRTISGTTLALMPVGLALIVANTVVFDASVENLPIFGGIVLLLAGLYVQARFGWSRLTANLLISVFWFAPTTLILMRGLNTSNWAFLLLLPVMALLLADRKHGFIWGLVAAATMWLFSWLTLSGHMALGVRPDVHATAIAISGPLMTMMLCLAAAVFRGAQIAAEKKLLDHVERLNREVETRRAAEEAALAAERSKAVFLTTMSHELRTPLNGVIGAGQLLKNTPLNAEQSELIDVVSSSGEFLLELINNVLDLSKLEAGRLELDESSINLEQLVASAIAPLKLQAREKGIDIGYTIDRDAPAHVRGDSMRLKQILLNLSGNALKFTTHGSVHINVSQDRGEIEFTVTDTGIGIPEESQAKLFQPFAQADASTARQFGGSGLGLTIVKHLIELMGGSISLTSTEGIGTIFHVRLPLEADTAAEQSATTAANNEPAAQSQLTVLVTDDNDVNRLVANRMLQRLRHNVLEARNGAEALEALECQQIDVVLMDVQMPVLDGLSATRKIRALDRPCATVPIIGLSANVLEDDRNDMLAAGMDDCLAKPVRFEELSETLDRHATAQMSTR